jgi:hypothetical protein
VDAGYSPTPGRPRIFISGILERADARDTAVGGLMLKSHVTTGKQ